MHSFNEINSHSTQAQQAQGQLEAEVGPARAVLLREEIARHLPLYEFHAGHSHTHITTLYFDTRERDFFRRAEKHYDDNVKIRVKEYYFWFRQDTIYGVTPRMELCP